MLTFISRSALVVALSTVDHRVTHINISLYNGMPLVSTQRPKKIISTAVALVVVLNSPRGLTHWSQPPVRPELQQKAIKAHYVL